MEEERKVRVECMYRRMRPVAAPQQGFEWPVTSRKIRDLVGVWGRHSGLDDGSVVLERRDQEDQDCAVDCGRAYPRVRHCSAQNLQKLDLNAQSGARTRLVGWRLFTAVAPVNGCDDAGRVNGTRMRSATLCRD